MSDLNKVFGFVKSQLLLKPSDSKNTEIENFLNRLKNGDVNSKRLLVCLGIDLKTYEKLTSTGRKSQDFIDLIRKVIINIEQNNVTLKSYKGTPSPAVQFGISLSQIPSSECKPIIEIRLKSNYVRIVAFKDYINWIVRQNSYINPDVPADIYPGAMDKYYNEFINNGRYSNLKITNLGSGTGWVFIASENEFEEKFTKKDLTNILSVLGFYVDSIKKNECYVGMRYPKEFEEITYQPTTLTGDWGNYYTDRISVGNEFFLCYFKHDDWGRTFSITGDLTPAKERTHLKFDHYGNKTYDFSICDLGVLTNELAKTTEEVIIKEALTRFERS